jgi:hypothetical protein
MNSLSIISLLFSGFVILGCVALGASMLREIRHYRALKARHVENVRRLQSNLPRMRLKGIAHKYENDALRRLAVALIGYTGRLESELKEKDEMFAAQLMATAPPIIELTDAIQRKSWSEFDEILRGIPRSRRTTVKSVVS